MNFTQMFESATGVQVPDQIAGIDIPSPDLQDITEAADSVLGTSITDTVADATQLFDKAVQVRKVVASGKRTAGDCYATIDRAQDVYDSINREIEPYEPLLKLDYRDMAGSISVFNKEGLDACMKIMGDVLDLGKLLQKIADILGGVQKVFETIMRLCGDVVDAVKGYIPEIAAALSDALNLQASLGGIQELWSGLNKVIAEMSSISSDLRPILEAWNSANWFEGATFGATHMEEAKGAFMRFWPAWEASHAEYKKSRAIGSQAWERSKDVYVKYKDVTKALSEYTGIELPGGPDAEDERARPRCLARGGVNIEDAPVKKVTEDWEDDESSDPTPSCECVNLLLPFLPKGMLGSQ